MTSFEFYTAARIIFGAGTVEQVGGVTRDLGSRALLVLGRESARANGLRSRLERLLGPASVACCEGEPGVADVDRAVAAAREEGCDVVVAAGGGSVLDCGKAAAGMLTNAGSLRDYLEGVGEGLVIERRPVPMVAVPTTAGTGSEVTKNAVISGPGYKKSVRSPMLIPDVALVDPELTHTAPRAITASCGMDALTQLIESYLSVNASPLTDGLCLQGIRAAGRGLVAACDRPADSAAREDMALASLLGGICLANAGLGAVHGFASPLGALYPVPHGVACAALLPQVVQANLEAARGTDQERRLVKRVSTIGQVFCGGRDELPSPARAQECCDDLKQLQRRLEIPTLGAMGVEEGLLGQIAVGARGSSMRFNPVKLSDDQLMAILHGAY